MSESRGRRKLVAAAGVAALPFVLVVAGCAGGANTAASPPSPRVARTAVVEAGLSSLGGMLTDSRGRTAYVFDRDTASKSTCFGACARLWPPLRTVRRVKAGQGAASALIGTQLRRDGARQVTYDGHPLYYYSGDHGPDETNGEGLEQFGGRWHLVSPSGLVMDGNTATSSAGDSGD